MIRIRSMVAIAAIFLTLPLFAQNVGIGTTMPSEKLDVNGQIRMRAGAVDGYIPVSDTIGVMTWTDPAILLSSEFWSINGNTGTDDTNNFIGTLDYQDLVFRTNNLENVRINTSGNIDIGSTLDNARIYAHILNTDGSTAHGIYSYHDGSTTDTSYGIRNRNFSSSNNPKFGFFNHVNSEGTGIRYGIFNQVNQDTGTSADVFGEYNRLLGSGDGTKYALYNSIEDSGGGIRYGVYNNILAAGVGAKYGLRNEFSDVQGDKYGVYNHIPNGSATGTIYGLYNLIDSDADAMKYGVYNYITGGDNIVYGSHNYIDAATSNSSDLYGVYSEVLPSGTGTHYGGYFSALGAGNYAIYADNKDNSGWAGYFNGDLLVRSVGRSHLLWSDYSEDLVRVGTSSTASDQHNGNTVAGNTVNYVIDMDNGTAEGTAIGIGSVEYLLDLSNQTAISNHFTPTVDGSYSLGSASLRWSSVYAANGSIVTSDEREKEDIKPMHYGLNEVMQLHPVSYKWKQEQGPADLKEGDKELKLGLIAQDVLMVIPEVVQTHEWKALSEEQPDVFERVPLERLGMSYHELIPVLIHAMQQQQGVIDQQDLRVSKLEAQVKALQQQLSAED